MLPSHAAPVHDEQLLFVLLAIFALSLGVRDKQKKLLFAASPVAVSLLPQTGTVSVADHPLSLFRFHLTVLSQPFSTSPHFASNTQFSTLALCNISIHFFEKNAL